MECSPGAAGSKTSELSTTLCFFRNRSYGGVCRPREEAGNHIPMADVEGPRKGIASPKGTRRERAALAGRPLPHRIERIDASRNGSICKAEVVIWPAGLQPR